MFPPEFHLEKEQPVKRLLLFTLLLAGCGRGFDFSDGQRTGVIYKFSRKGIVCKTWEGTMAISTGQAVAELVNFDFAVENEDPALIAEVNRVINSGERVRLTYNQRQLTGLCAPDSNYWITKVESVK